MLYSLSAISTITLTDLDGAVLNAGTVTPLLEPLGAYTSDDLRSSNVLETSITGGTAILFGPNNIILDTIKNAGTGTIVGTDSDNIDVNSVGANLISGNTIFSGNTDVETIIRNLADGGEDNTASNVGSGSGLFKEKSGVDLRFKSLSAGTNMNIIDSDDVLVISASTNGGVTLSLEYKFDSSTSEINPGKGKFKLNNSNPSIATKIFINEETDNGTEMQTIFTSIESGDRAYFQQLNDADRFGLYEITGTTNNGVWWTFDVSHESGLVLPQNNRSCGVLLFATSPGTDTYVDSATFGVSAADTLRIGRNDGNNVDVVVNDFTSLTADTIYSGSTDLDDIFVSKVGEKYTTAATITDGVVYFDRTDSLSAYTLDIGVLTSDTVSYTIWAEEGTTLTNNNRQWSFGNGATGPINVYAMEDGEISKMFLQAESEGTTATIDVMINDVVAGTGTFNVSGIFTFGSPISVFEGDEIGFQTNTVTGTWADARVGVSVEKELEGIKGAKGDKGDKGDAGTPFSGGVASFFDGYDSSGGLTTVTNVWSAPIPLDSQRKTSSEFSHNISVNNSEVTINETSTYFVLGRVTTQATASTSRTEGECRLELFTGSTWDSVPGTTADMYLRQTSYGATGVFYAALDLEAGWKLRMNMRRVLGNANMTAQAEGSSLSIVKFQGPKGEKGDTGTSTGITHDRQEVYLTASTNTTSATPVDLDGMSITTKDLGGGATYDISFTASRSNSTSNVLNFFYITVDGVIVSQKRISTFSNEIHTAVVLAKVEGINSGTLIKVQYDAQAGGTHTVYERTLSIDGILDDNVKQ